MKPLSPRSQRGVATLAIAAMLVGVIILGVGFANRSLMFEQKTAANQYRATQAFEAAEAGVEWAIALLNSNSPIDERCQLSNQASDSAFRDRYLGDPAPNGAFTPRTFPLNGNRQNLQPACLKTDNGWSCSCPASGLPTLPDGASNIGFVVRLEASEQPGVLQLVSSGCSGAGTPCVPGHSGKADASARVRVLLGRTAGLSAEPGAALMVRGSVDAVTATFAVHNTEPAGGVTIHSGGGIDAPLAQLSTVPGAPAAASLLDHDPELAKISATGFFASMFQMNKNAWRNQSVVRQLTCEGPCDTALSQAIGTGVIHPLIWVDKGLRLDTPAVLGSIERPVLLVIDGPVQFNAPVVIHGLVYATQSSWVDNAGAEIHGAVILENDLQGTGSTQIHHDAAALKLLHTRSGTFARVPGSWQDF